VLYFNAVASVVFINLYEGCTRSAGTPPAIAYYLRNIGLKKFGESSIALRSPTPDMSLPRQLQQANKCVRDIGFLNTFVGVETKFNVFLSKEDNELLGYHPAEDFIPFTDIPPLFCPPKIRTGFHFFAKGNIKKLSQSQSQKG
jgi:hypothetical protein